MQQQDDLREKTDQPAPRAPLAHFVGKQVSRFALAQAIASDDHRKAWRTLHDKYELWFSNLDATAAAKPDRYDENLWQATFPTSPLSSRMLQLLNQPSEVPLAAIVLLSDGLLHDDQPWSTVVRVAQQRHVPIFTIATGSPYPSMAAYLNGLTIPTTASLGDIIPCGATLHVQGQPGHIWEVSIWESDAKEPLARQTHAVDDMQADRRVSLPFSPTTAGLFRAQIVLRDLTEPTREWQSIPIQIDVRDEPLRILLVADQPSYEYRSLKSLLSRYRTPTSDTVATDLRCYLQSAAPEYAASDSSVISLFPQTAEELRTYDVLIWCDADPNRLTPSMQQMVYDFVAVEGHGLALLAGHRHIPATLYSMPWYRLWGSERPTNHTLGNPTNNNAPRSYEWQLSELGRQRVFWENPTANAPHYWRPPLGPSKQSVQVLAHSTATHAHPLSPNDHTSQAAAWLHYVGSGRVLVHAMEETWRWKSADEQLYSRYWVPTLRTLRPKSTRDLTKSILTATPSASTVGRTIHFQLELARSDRLHLEPPYEVWVESTEGVSQVVPLTAEDESYSTFYGQVSYLRAGKYVAHLHRPVERRDISCEFTLNEQNLEQQILPINEQSLRYVAQSTQGAYYVWHDSPRLFSDLAKMSQQHTIDLPDVTLWNAWPCSFLVVALLTAEWYLRRRMGQI